jgi:hypothetical protein
VVGARRAGLILVVAVSAFSGCGGGEPEDGRLTKEDYDSAAERALEAFGALEELEPPAADPASVDSYVAEVQTIFDSAINDLRAIEPPEDVEPLHEELVAAIETYGAAFPPVADAANQGDDAALQGASTELQAAAFEFREVATDLGQRFEEEGIELKSLPE